MMHPSAVPLAENIKTHSRMFGFDTEDIILPEKFLGHGQILTIGDNKLKVLYTPGHADGSVCFYSEDQDFITTGDVIFYQSIGRTDLPTGDYDLLLQSI